jgi:hypothetical protein
VSGFRIVQTAGGTSGLMFNANSGGSVAERMSITTGGSSTCRDNADGTVTIRDSVCVFTGSGFGAVLASSGDNQILNVRNVTAVSTSDGMPGVAVYGKDAQNTVVNVRNSIISGGGTTEDVHVQSLVTSGSNTVDLDYSDYDLASVPGVDTIVTEGLHNVSAAPLFTDTDVFFHQAGGYIPSPTIDKGSAAFTTGSLGDIDGGARSLGSAPDIGADEFVPAPTVTPTPPGPTAAAATGQRAAALKKCKKKKGKARKKCKKKAAKLPV